MKGDKVIITGPQAKELLEKIVDKDICFTMGEHELDGEKVVIFEAED